MFGARIFVAIVFVLLGAAFVASTGLLIYEFRGLDWATMVVAHSHLFLFFPVFGLLALLAFYLPSVVLTHLYWHYLPYGRARYAVGVLAIAALSYGMAWYLDKEPRAIYEASPRALKADQADATGARVPILQALADLRETAQSRFGVSAFARPCAKDPLLETPVEMQQERYCFPAGRNLNGEACCAVQAAYAKALSRLEREPATRSVSGVLDRLVFLPAKSFFILVVVAIAALLALWRGRIDAHYCQLVPQLERGVIVGGFAMLFWLGMDYGYLQTSNVLFGREVSGPQFRLSLVLVPWALFLVFFFMRRLGRQAEQVARMAGVIAAGVGVLRYEELSDWVVWLFGIGLQWWMLAGMGASALAALAILLWPRPVDSYASQPAQSQTDWPA